jgi:hypothetical protein
MAAVLATALFARRLAGTFDNRAKTPAASRRLALHWAKDPLTGELVCRWDVEAPEPVTRSLKAA